MLGSEEASIHPDHRGTHPYHVELEKDIEPAMKYGVNFLHKIKIQFRKLLQCLKLL